MCYEVPKYFWFPVLFCFLIKTNVFYGSSLTLYLCKWHVSISKGRWTVYSDSGVTCYIITFLGFATQVILQVTMSDKYFVTVGILFISACGFCCHMCHSCTHQCTIGAQWPSETKEKAKFTSWKFLNYLIFVGEKDKSNLIKMYVAPGWKMSAVKSCTSDVKKHLQDKHSSTYRGDAVGATAPLQLWLDLNQVKAAVLRKINNQHVACRVVREMLPTTIQSPPFH